MEWFKVNGPHVWNTAKQYSPVIKAYWQQWDSLDVMSAKIVGNVITAYINGVQKGQADITSIGGTVYTTGHPGMGFSQYNVPPGCPGTNGNYGFTSYTATDAP